ncbi:sugar transferase [Kiritimatiellaeota bacterium B1221]|nr:sugar transferase [Kiritimatiellaeota bacterium B1221]
MNQDLYLARKELINSLDLPASKMDLKKLQRRQRTKLLIWEMSLRSLYVIKRTVDVLAASLGMLVLSPVFLILILCIVIEDGWPVFYSQPRVGQNGRVFRFYKFRSMVRNADKIKEELMTQNESGDGVIFKMKNDPRITRIGRFIRRYSLDELPQLFNVLTGDMSLVGPRPPIPSEVAEYSLEDRKRLHVKPGITCIWQVSGRSDIPFKEQVQLDVQYIRTQGFWNDIKLLLKTIPAVLLGKGAY